MIAVFVFGMGFGSQLGPGVVQGIAAVLALPVVCLLALTATLRGKWQRKTAAHEGAADGAV